MLFMPRRSLEIQATKFLYLYIEAQFPFFKAFYELRLKAKHDILNTQQIVKHCWKPKIAFQARN